MKNATFLSRIGAYLIDSLILSPAALLIFLGAHFSLGLGVSIRILFIPAWFIYTVYFIALRGQTIGKKAMDIKVVRCDGRPVDRTTAMARSAIDLGFSVATGMAFLSNYFETVATALAPGTEYSSLSLLEKINLMGAGSAVGFAVFLNYASYAYTIAQIISFYVNSQNRAIHDLVAGTRVIQADVLAADAAI